MFKEFVLKNKDTNFESISLVMFFSISETVGEILCVN